MGKLHSRYFATQQKSSSSIDSDFHYINDREHRAFYQRARAYSKKIQLRRSIIVHLEPKEQDTESTLAPNSLFSQSTDRSQKHVPSITQIALKGFSPSSELTSSPPFFSISSDISLVRPSPRRKGKLQPLRIEWNEEDEPTCGWLLSEVERLVIAQLKHYGRQEEIIDRKWSSLTQAPYLSRSSSKRHLDLGKKRKVIVALKSRNNLEALDQWLLEYQRPLFVLEELDELEVVWGSEEEIQAKINQPPSIGNFEFVKVLGKGGYSKVIEVRNKLDGKLYALKSLRKVTKYELTHGAGNAAVNSKIKQIETENRILNTIGYHPFLVRSHCPPLISQNYINFVLDFCPGGELFFHLLKKGRFTEPVAKFYFVEVLLAIQHLHNNNIIYRDLKPENILLDLDGHIKLTDFGLSRHNFTAKDRSNSFCGSPEYISPEMLRQGRTHGRMVDFYSLGALFYELLVGYPPFYSRNKQEIYESVLYSAVGFPDFISAPARELIQALLVKNPDRRLGSRNGVRDIKNHPYFEDVSWELFYQKRAVAPIIPSIHSSNFDSNFLEMAPKFSLEMEDLNFHHKLTPRQDHHDPTEKKLSSQLEVRHHRTHSEPNINAVQGNVTKRKKELHFPESTFERKASKAESLLMLGTPEPAKLQDEKQIYQKRPQRQSKIPNINVRLQTQEKSTGRESKETVHKKTNFAQKKTKPRAKANLKIGKEAPPQALGKTSIPNKYSSFKGNSTQRGVHRTVAHLSIDLGKASNQSTPKARLESTQSSHKKTIVRTNTSVDTRIQQDKKKRLFKKKSSQQISIGEPQIQSQEMPIKQLPQFTIASNRGLQFKETKHKSHNSQIIPKNSMLSPLHSKESARVDSGKIPSLNEKLITENSPFICESASKRLLSPQGNAPDEQLEDFVVLFTRNLASKQQTENQKRIKAESQINISKKGKTIETPSLFSIKSTPLSRSSATAKQYFTLNMHPHVTVPLQDTPTKDQSSVHVESDAELHFSSKGFKDSRILKYRYSNGSLQGQTHQIRELTEEERNMSHCKIIETTVSRENSSMISLKSMAGQKAADFTHHRQTSLTGFYRDSCLTNPLSFDKITAEHALTPDLSNRGNSLGPKLSLNQNSDTDPSMEAINRRNSQLSLQSYKLTRRVEAGEPTRRESSGLLLTLRQLENLKEEENVRKEETSPEQNIKKLHKPGKTYNRVGSYQLGSKLELHSTDLLGTPGKIVKPDMKEMTFKRFHSDRPSPILPPKPNITRRESSPVEFEKFQDIRLAMGDQILLSPSNTNLHESFIKAKGRRDKQLKTSKSTVLAKPNENTAVLRARVSAQLATLRNKELLKETSKVQEEFNQSTSQIKLSSERLPSKPINIVLSQGDEERGGGGAKKYFMIHDEGTTHPIHSRKPPKLQSPEFESSSRREVSRMNEIRAFDENFLKKGKSMERTSIPRFSKMVMPVNAGNTPQISIETSQYSGVGTQEQDRRKYEVVSPGVSSYYTHSMRNKFAERVKTKSD